MSPGKTVKCFNVDVQCVLIDTCVANMNGHKHQESHKILVVA